MPRGQPGRRDQRFRDSGSAGGGTIPLPHSSVVTPTLGRLRAGNTVRRRSRTRRVLKWVATSAGGALLLLCGLSSCYPLNWNTGGHIGGIRSGRLWVSELPAASQAVAFSWSIGRFSNPLPAYVPDGVVGIPASPYWWRPKNWADAGTTALGLRWWFISMWVALCVIAVPAAVLWWADRPRRPRRSRLAYCQKCGYNLTGNVSGRCPECGTPIGGTR